MARISRNRLKQTNKNRVIFAKQRNVATFCKRTLFHIHTRGQSGWINDGITITSGSLFLFCSFSLAFCKSNETKPPVCIDRKSVRKSGNALLKIASRNERGDICLRAGRFIWPYVYLQTLFPIGNVFTFSFWGGSPHR